MVKVGEVFNTKHGECVVTEVVDEFEVGVKFSTTNNIVWTSLKKLKGGKVKDTQQSCWHDRKLYEGKLRMASKREAIKKFLYGEDGTKRFSTNRSGDFSVESYINSEEIVIKFVDSGNLKTTTLDQIKKGLILDKDAADKIRAERLLCKRKAIGKQDIVLNKMESVLNRVHTTSAISEIDVSELPLVSYKVDEDVVTKDYKQLKVMLNNAIPELATVRGVGSAPKGSSKDELYRTWSNLLYRNYGNNTSFKDFVNYIICYVCDDWLFFDKFREWVLNQELPTCKFNIDKDLLSSINDDIKVYSPDTCLVLPYSINTALSVYRPMSDNTGALGVSATKSGTYVSRIRDGNTKVTLGTFDNVDHAHRAWQIATAEKFKLLAKYWSDYKFSKYLHLLSDSIKEDVSKGLRTLQLSVGHVL